MENQLQPIEEVKPIQTKEKFALEGILKPAEYMAFIDWCATPEPLRELKTQKELAVQLKVEESTLSDWKKRPDFFDHVREGTKQWGKERTANVMASMYRKIMKFGDAQEVKLWLQYMEDWAERKEVDTRGVFTTFEIVRGVQPHENVPTESTA